MKLVIKTINTHYVWEHGHMTTYAYSTCMDSALLAFSCDRDSRLGSSGDSTRPEILRTVPSAWAPQLYHVPCLLLLYRSGQSEAIYDYGAQNIPHLNSKFQSHVRSFLRPENINDLIRTLYLYGALPKYAPRGDPASAGMLVANTRSSA